MRALWRVVVRDNQWRDGEFVLDGNKLPEFPDEWAVVHVRYEPGRESFGRYLAGEYHVLLAR